MAKSCAACGKFLSQAGAASCGSCPSMYHRACVAISETAVINKNWLCPECKGKERKTDETPVKSISSNTSQLSICNDVYELRKELKEVLTELRNFKDEITELKALMTGCNQRLDAFERRLETVEQRNNNCAPASDELVGLQETVIRLKSELNDRDQDSMLADLEIGHLPEEKGENLVHTISILATKLGVTLQEDDIVFAERVGALPRAGGGALEGRARRVVVRLARRRDRDQLLSAARVRRTLTTTDIGACATSATSSQRYYLNERLTQYNRHLFHLVREACRKLQWRFSWTKRGRIFAREAEGKPVHSFRVEADLARIFGPGLV